jgi:hypothetical protein
MLGHEVFNAEGAEIEHRGHGVLTSWASQVQSRGWNSAMRFGWGVVAGFSHGSVAITDVQGP